VEELLAYLDRSKKFQGDGPDSATNTGKKESVNRIDPKLNPDPNSNRRPNPNSNHNSNPNTNPYRVPQELCLSFHGN
jgi:hypothetical protein